MEDLSHWDFAVHFNGYDVAALILGIEPRKSLPYDHRVRVVVQRLEHDYERAYQQLRWEIDIFSDEDLVKESKAKPPEDLLVSVALKKMWADVDAGVPDADFNVLIDDDLPQFETQMFTREAISNWLKAVGMPSQYPFENGPLNSQEVDHQNDFEPTDLPWELDLARIAYRAVKNGYGKPGETFRNRLEEYLRQNYSGLKESEIERISTVANPDKDRGRKKKCH